MSAVCHFPDPWNQQFKQLKQIIQYGVPIARIEMLNKDQMEISINYSKLENVEAVTNIIF